MYCPVVTSLKPGGWRRTGGSRLIPRPHTHAADLQLRQWFPTLQTLKAITPPLGLLFGSYHPEDEITSPVEKCILITYKLHIHRYTVISQ